MTMLKNSCQSINIKLTKPSFIHIQHNETRDSCIVLTVDEKILVINGKDEESTKEIYDELTKKINE